MKLTNYKRDVFIQAVLNALPQKDYDEKIRKLVEQDAINQLPFALFPLYEKYKDYFFHRFYYAGGATTVYVVCQEHTNFDVSPEVRKKVESLVCLKEEQKLTRSQLEKKLKTVVYGCNTLKQLEDCLPEFKKYMPKELDKAENLPAVANLVSDFVKAGFKFEGAKNAMD